MEMLLVMILSDLDKKPNETAVKALQRHLESSGLGRKLKALKKIRNFKGIDKSRIISLIQLVELLKESRNLFIHGIWEEPKEDGKNIFVKIKGTKIQLDPVKGLVVLKEQYTLN